MRNRLGRRGAALVAALGIAAAGCGQPADESRAKRNDVGELSTLLTGTEIARQVNARSVDEREPARTVLEFWRDTQYANYVKAYERLSDALRERVSYRAFVRTFRDAAPLFTVRPRVTEVETRQFSSTVYLRMQSGPEPSPKDPPSPSTQSSRGSAGSSRRTPATSSAQVRAPRQ